MFIESIIEVTRKQETEQNETDNGLIRSNCTCILLILQGLRLY